MNYAETLGVKAKAVESAIATAAPQVKNNALAAIADALLARQEEILAANAKDLEAAVQNHMTESLQDRLRLTPARISGMANAARQLIAAEDPIGSVDSGSVRPNGLQILKTRVPLGVIGIIFESRPNVTVDAATLCLKAGNVVILRGGKEAIHSNTALAEIMRDAVETAGLPKDIIQLVEDTSRETAADMMHLTGYLDVLIPRGGAGLIQAVLRQSTVPVIETGAGNCHVYVDSCLHGEADYEMAVRIIDNAKTQRPSVCNAIEGLIVHQDVAAEILPRVQAAFRTHDVTIYGDEQTRKILGDAVQPVTEELYDTEFNDYKITVKVVASLDEDQLLYEMALYNFTSFMVRNFDIDIVKADGLAQMRVSGFLNYDEAHAYAQKLYADPHMSVVLKNIRSVIISESNLKLLGTVFSFDDYKKFYDEKFAPLQVPEDLRLDEPTSIEIRTPDDEPPAGDEEYEEEEEDTDSGIIF